MKAIPVACLLLTVSLFADPFIIFPESFRKPPKPAATKSKPIDSTAIYNDPFLSPLALDNFEPVELNPQTMRIPLSPSETRSA